MVSDESINRPKVRSPVIARSAIAMWDYAMILAVGFQA